MTRLHSFRDNKSGCFANIRMDNDDPVFIGVARTGVLVKKSKLGIFGPKLYDSRTVAEAANTAQNLHGQYRDYLGPNEMTSPVLRAFTNAALHCSTVAELTLVLNKANREPDIAALEATASSITQAYGELLVEISQGTYPAGVYPESLLPVPRDFLAQVLAFQIETATDPTTKRQLENGLALLEAFINDSQAIRQNEEIKALNQQGV